MRAKRNTRIYLLISGLMGFIAVLSYLSWANSVNPGIKTGSRMPRLSYLTTNGIGNLKPDPTYDQLVVLFNQSCPACFEQLSAFERDIGILRPDLKVLFLTTEMDFIVQERSKKWKNLHTSKRCVFAVIRPRSILRVFGSLITPAYYLFNRDGILIWRSSGKTDLGQINGIPPRGNINN